MQKALFVTCNAVLPIILLILLGYIVKRTKLFTQDFFSQLNKLCFRICLPALLFCNIYNVTDLDAIQKNYKIALFAVTAITAAFFAGLLIVKCCIKQQNQKGVVLQCVFRSNFAIIGLPLVSFLTKNNPEQMATASVLAAASIPVFNILATVALSIFAEQNNGSVTNRVSVAKIIKRIATNPLIIGVCMGIAALAIRQLLPQNTEGQPIFSIKNNLPFLYTALEMISAATTPVALLALGGDFTFSATKRLRRQVILATAARTVLVPFFCLVAAYNLGFKGATLPSLIALFGTPVAVSSVPMSAEMNGDTELAGQLVVWTSLTSAITLSVTIFICAALGLF